MNTPSPKNLSEGQRQLWLDLRDVRNARLKELESDPERLGSMGAGPVLFTNRELLLIVHGMPADMAELQEIDGIDTARVDRWGLLFLAALHGLPVPDCQEVQDLDGEGVGARARRALRSMLGADARFRSGQLDSIEAVVRDRKRVLVVQRTGWGKSIVYFIATRLLRDEGLGPTLLISPLLSLIRDQILMAERIGVRALTMNSGNREEWPSVEDALKKGECDLLLVSPERLGTERFLDQTLPAMGKDGPGLFVVDEAHCISDWGHDFRPDYRRIKRIVRDLPPSVPVLATTATANDRVIEDVAEQLGPDMVVERGSLARDSLRLQSITLADQAERYAWLAKHLDELPGSGIVYCLTVDDTEWLARWLRTRGLKCEAYHSQLLEDEKLLREAALRGNKVKALVATVALGMGFDKPDMGFVVHFQRPGSVIAYYQQIGRAGRALDEAYAIVLTGSEDDDIVNYFIDSAFPPNDRMLAVLQALEESDDGLALEALEAELNFKRGQLQKALKLLTVDGAVIHEHGTYRRTANPWSYDEERVERVTALRRLELDQMREYVALTTCQMEYVTKALDDRDAKVCGHCSNCAGPLVSEAVDHAVVVEAVRFLRGAHIDIPQRKKLPFPVAMNGQVFIPESLRNCEGLALCSYGDAGWGQLVRAGKYEVGRFDDQLVAASADHIREHWSPSSDNWWVTCVPSLRNASLVSDFANRLARELGLSFVEALSKTKDTPPQKDMQNWVQQAQNVAAVFAADPKLCRAQKAILVDDMFDSRWTFTFCGIRLRQAGSGPVYPFALARAGGVD
jgi:ATP-dependent DNA helicase RecQ